MSTPNGDASTAPVPSSWARAVTMLGRLAPSAIPTSIGGALAHGAVRSLAVNVAGTGVSFAVQILLARQLGHDGLDAGAPLTDGRTDGIEALLA